MGVKYAIKVLGTGRDGQFSKIIDNFWKKMTNPTGPRTFFKRFYTHKYNSKRIFYSDQIWSSTDWLHFWLSRPLCSSRLMPQEKSLVDQLPLDQSLLKTVLSMTLFRIDDPYCACGTFLEVGSTTFKWTSGQVRDLDQLSFTLRCPQNRLLQECSTKPQLVTSHSRRIRSATNTARGFAKGSVTPSAKLKQLHYYF